MTQEEGGSGGGAGSGSVSTIVATSKGTVKADASSNPGDITERDADAMLPVPITSKAEMDEHLRPDEHLTSALQPGADEQAEEAGVKSMTEHVPEAGRVSEIQSEQDEGSERPTISPDVQQSPEEAPEAERQADDSFAAVSPNGPPSAPPLVEPARDIAPNEDSTASPAPVTEPERQTAVVNEILSPAEQERVNEQEGSVEQTQTSTDDAQRSESVKIDGEQRTESEIFPGAEKEEEVTPPVPAAGQDHQPPVIQEESSQPAEEDVVAVEADEQMAESDKAVALPEGSHVVTLDEEKQVNGSAEASDVQASATPTRLASETTAEPPIAPASPDREAKADIWTEQRTKDEDFSPDPPAVAAASVTAGRAEEDGRETKTDEADKVAEPDTEMTQASSDPQLAQPAREELAKPTAGTADVSAAAAAQPSFSSRDQTETLRAATQDDGTSSAADSARPSALGGAAIVTDGDVIAAQEDRAQDQIRASEFAAERQPMSNSHAEDTAGDTVMPTAVQQHTERPALQPLSTSTRLAPSTTTVVDTGAGDAIPGSPSGGHRAPTAMDILADEGVKTEKEEEEKAGAAMQSGAATPIAAASTTNAISQPHAEQASSNSQPHKAPDDVDDSTLARKITAAAQEGSDADPASAAQTSAPLPSVVSTAKLVEAQPNEQQTDGLSTVPAGDDGLAGASVPLMDTIAAATIASPSTSASGSATAKTTTANTAEAEASPQGDPLAAKQIALLLKINKELIRLCIDLQSRDLTADPTYKDAAVRLQANLAFLASMTEPTGQKNPSQANVALNDEPFPVTPLAVDSLLPKLYAHLRTLSSPHHSSPTAAAGKKRRRDGSDQGTQRQRAAPAARNVDRAPSAPHTPKAQGNRRRSSVANAAAASPSLAAPITSVPTPMAASTFPSTQPTMTAALPPAFSAAPSPAPMASGPRDSAPVSVHQQQQANVPPRLAASPAPSAAAASLSNGNRSSGPTSQQLQGLVQAFGQNAVNNLNALQAHYRGGQSQPLVAYMEANVPNFRSLPLQMQLQQMATAQNTAMQRQRQASVGSASSPGPSGALPQPQARPTPPPTAQRRPSAAPSPVGPGGAEHLRRSTQSPMAAPATPFQQQQTPSTPMSVSMPFRNMASPATSAASPGAFGQNQMMQTQSQQQPQQQPGYGFPPQQQQPVNAQGQQPMSSLPASLSGLPAHLQQQLFQQLFMQQQQQQLQVNQQHQQPGHPMAPPPGMNPMMAAMLNQAQHAQAGQGQGQGQAAQGGGSPAGSFRQAGVGVGTPGGSAGGGGMPNLANMWAAMQQQQQPPSSNS